MWGEKRFTPSDAKKYIVPKDAVAYTEKVLIDYGKKRPPNEGLVYWAGTIIDQVINVKLVIAPRTNSESQRVITSPESNVRMIQVLNEHGMIHLGQVHSHPGSWVDHSEGDNEYAPFKINGLLSLVVPTYCNTGMMPIEMCGIHRFEYTDFIRLSDEYIAMHFNIVEAKCFFKDLRNEKF